MLSHTGFVALSAFAVVSILSGTAFGHVGAGPLASVSGTESPLYDWEEAPVADGRGGVAQLYDWEEAPIIDRPASQPLYDWEEAPIIDPRGDFDRNEGRDAELERTPDAAPEF